MPTAIQRVFISACTRDLRGFRRVLTAALLRLGYFPVVQENFSLTTVALRQKLSSLIDDCQFVIHLAGKCYGAEPRDHGTGPRRSYTQHEYYHAREKGTPVYAFLCDDAFPYDRPDPKRYPNPESQEIAALQEAHRLFIKGTPEGQDYTTVKSIREGIAKFTEARPQFCGLCQHLENFLPGIDKTVTALQSDLAILIGIATETRDIVKIVLENTEKLLARAAADPTQANPWVMPQRADTFFGREEQFCQLLSLWDQHRCLTITGSGGLGKTGLAAEILAWYAPAADPTDPPAVRLFLHDFYTQGSHLAALSSILTQAEIDQHGLSKEQQETIVQKVLNQPGSHLYLEGCEKAESLSDLLRLTGTARVLLTSRDKTPPPGTHGYDLPPLALEDATALIAHHAGYHLEDHPAPDDLVNLAHYLGQHALACSQAGRLLRETADPPAALLAALKKHGLSQLEGEQREHHSISYLLGQTLRHLHAKFPLRASIWHLLGLGALAPMPFSLFVQLAGLEQSLLRSTLNELQRLGITRSASVPASPPATPEPGWTLQHALHQTFAIHDLPRHPLAPNTPALYRRWRDAWVTFLRKCNDNYRFPGGYQRYDALLPHFSSLLHAIDRHEPQNAYLRFWFLNYIATQHRYHGRYLLAEPLYQQALNLSEAHFGKEASATLAILNNLAILLRAKGDLAGAQPLYERALKASERTLGPEHPDTLASLNNLANLLTDKGDLAGAQPLYERALEAQERTLGPEHPHTLSSLSGMGSLLYQKGDLAGAQSLYERALEAQERTLGPEHPDTLLSLNGMGSLLFEKDDLAGAEAYFLRAVEGARKQLLPEHPHRQMYERNLAAVRKELGRE